MSNPMPVVAHFRGDFLYNLVLVEDTDTVSEVARKCAEHSVGRRVPVQDAPLRVECGGSFPGRLAHSFRGRHLHSVHIGRCHRVRARDVDAYVDRLGTGAA